MSCPLPLARHAAAPWPDEADPVHIGVLHAGDTTGIGSGRGDDLGQPTTVQWHSLSARDTLLVPGAARLRWIGAQASGRPRRVDAAVRRRNEHASRFLTPPTTAWSTARAGAGVMVQDPRVAGQTPLVFSPCPWTNPGKGHFVYPRGFTAWLPELATSELRMVVGSCLFSTAAVRMTGSDGREYRLDDLDDLVSPHTIVRIHVDEDLSLYELEQTQRVAGYVGDQAAVLPASTLLTVLIDVARLQYIGSLLGHYLAGRVSLGLLLQWWQLVDQRWSRLTARLRDLIRIQTWAAGRPGVRIDLASSLQPALTALRAAITRRPRGVTRERELVDELLDAMLHSGHATDAAEWTALMRYVQPATVRELALAGYVWTLTQPALTPPPSRRRAGDRPVITVLVDDVSELQMYLAADRVMAAAAAAQPDRAAMSALVAVFLLRRLVVAGDPVTRSLFWSVRDHGFRAADGTPVTSRQLVAQTIPTQPRLRSWR